MNVILDLSELNARYNRREFYPINTLIDFKEITLICFIDPIEVNSTVWYSLEQYTDLEFANLTQDKLLALDLMIDLFHESVHTFSSNLLGQNIDNFNYEVLDVKNEAVYLRMVK